MTSPLARIESYLQESKRLIAIKYEELITLVELAEKRYLEKQAEVEKRKIRLIVYGGGCKAEMTPKEGVSLCLVDLRQTPTFKILGLVFDLWMTKANNTLNYWVEILRKILPVSQIEEAKRDKQKYQELWEGLSEYLLILDILIDSAEQAIERPGNYQHQRKYYSGEKKIHTLKNQFRVLPGGEDIVDIYIGELGNISDITVFRNNRQNLDAKQRFLGDKAYIGEEFITTAYKKPKKAEPLEIQKEENIIKKNWC
jgi:hypothetical protein